MRSSRLPKLMVMAALYTTIIMNKATYRASWYHITTNVHDDLQKEARIDTDVQNFTLFYVKEHGIRVAAK